MGKEIGGKVGEEAQSSRPGGGLCRVARESWLQTEDMFVYVHI